MLQKPFVLSGWVVSQQRLEFSIRQAVLFVHAQKFLCLMRVLWTRAIPGFLHRQHDR